MDEKAARVWFDVFRSKALIFHGFLYALAVHHDLLCNRISWTTSRATLVHKTRTIELLNDVLSKLTDDNIDLAILAVLVLASNELRPEKVMLPSKTPPFDPHMPAANWVSVYARMDQV